MPWRKMSPVKFWGGVVVLCVLAALASMGLSRFIESFYSYTPSVYEPKDLTREQQLEKSRE